MNNKALMKGWVLASAASLALAGVQSCGSLSKLPGPLGDDSSSETVETVQSTEAPEPSAATKTAESFVAKFLSLQESVVIDDKTPVKIELSFSHTDSGKWSVYVSEKQNGFVDSKALAKDLDLTQSSFEWNPTDFAAGTYFVTVVVDRLGDTQVFQPAGKVTIASKDANNVPFVSIIIPNNTFRMNNQTNTNEMIGNNTDRLRFPLGEPLRVVYRYRDVDSDPVTLSLDISKDGVNWQNVVEKITPGSPTVEGGSEYLFEWTPPADLDPNMYTLRLHIDDGKAKSYGDQKFIGIGDTTWDGGVNQLYATNCAMSGCHSATQPARNRDFTRHSRLTGYDGNVATDLNDNCVSCHGNTDPQKGIKLNTYADAKANADAIKAVIEANSMPVTLSDTTPPVQTFVPLRDDVKARILKWIADGALRQDILGAGDIQNIDTQLVKYWLEPKGTTNRDRRAMPPGPAPLPAEVLGKFLIWNMQGSNWNTGNRRYDGVGNERRRKN